MAGKKSDVELVISARNETEKTLTELLATIKKLSESSDDLAGNQKELKDAFRAVQQIEEALVKTGQDRDRSLQKQQTIIEKTKDSLDALNAKYQELQTASTQAREPSERLVDTLDKQQKRQRELADAIQDTSRKLADAQAASSLDPQASKAIDVERKKVIDLGQSWRETTNAIKAAKQVLAQREVVKNTAEQGQTEAKARLDSLREELKGARELAALRRKEVTEASEASQEQVAARDEAAAAVKRLKVAVEAQAKAERAVREEHDKATKGYNDQNKVIDRLVTKAGKQKAAYDDLKTSLVEFENAQSKLSTERQQANIDRLNQQLKDLQQQYKGVSERVVASQTKLDQATGPSTRTLTSLDALKVKIAETEAQLQKQTEELQKTKQQYDQAGVGADNLTKDQAELKAATEQLVAAQKRLKPALDETGKAAKGVEQSTGGAAKKIRLMGEGSRQSLSFLQRIRGEMLSLIASLTGLYALGEGVRSIYDSSVLLEKATARLAAKFNGDFTKIGTEIEFVRNESERLGVEFKTLLDQYTRFINSVPDNTLTLDQIRYTFVGVAEAGRVAGLSTDDFNGVFTALSQIASKGTVALEELRGQIAERIPGAVELMSKGLTDVSGELITVEELMARISKGELNANSIVAFAKALKDEFGPGLELATNSGVAQMARFKNALTDVQLQFAKAGFIDELTNALKTLVIELKSDEAQASIKEIAKAVSAAIRYFSMFISKLDEMAGFFIGIIALKFGKAMTNIAVAVLDNTSAMRKSLPILTSYGSAMAYLKATAIALGRALLIIPGLFYAALSAGELFFDTFKGAERFMRKVFLSIIFGFENLAITVQEKTDLMTTYFSRGWINVLRDIAKVVTDLLPYALTVMMRRVADNVEIFSKDIADKIRRAADAVNQSNDDLVDYLYDKVAPNINVDLQLDQIRKDAQEAKAAVLDEMEIMFNDIDKDPPKIIPPDQGKVEGDRFGDDFLASLGDIDFFKAGSDAGSELGEGLLSELQKIERTLKEETADTLEERLKLIETEYDEFLKKLGDFQVGSGQDITKIQTDAQEQIEAIRANAGMKEEARAKAIANIELRTAQEVNKIRTQQGQMGNARSVVQQLIEVRKEKERTDYYNDKATKSEKAINDLISARKDQQSRINELAEVGLITTDEQAARLRALNEQAFQDIRKAVEEARRLAETTGNASLTAFVAEFDGFEALERRRALVDEMQSMEERINDELELRETKLDTLNTLRENGVIDTAVAEEESRRVLEESNAVLSQMVDKAIDFAQNMGDEQMIARLQGVKAQLVGLNTQIFSGAQLSDDFASGFTGAFRSFIDGTKSASEAFRSFVSDFLANIAEAIMQAVILKAITGSFAGGSGGIGGAIAGGLNTLFNHQGGIVGVDGYRRMVNPLVFANAVRYHSGGVAGLKPDEVPTILQRGEEVLTASDPRHRNNTGSSGQQIGVKIINTIDTGSVVSEGLNTSAGQKAIVNAIRANKSSIKSMLV